jgi:peptidoglycan/LPS O-acetylase OafA/YrhL
LDAFGLGLTAAWLVRSDRWTRWPGQRRLLWSVLALSGGWFAWLVKLHAPAVAHSSWGYTVIAVFFAALLLLVHTPREMIVRRLFTAWPLLIYGRYSYFVYLFQWVAGSFLAALLFHGTLGLKPELNWLEVFIVPVLILAPAWLSWRFFEAPLLRLGKRFAY